MSRTLVVICRSCNATMSPVAISTVSIPRACAPQSKSLEADAVVIPGGTVKNGGFIRFLLRECAGGHGTHARFGNRVRGDTEGMERKCCNGFQTLHERIGIGSCRRYHLDENHEPLI